MRVNGSRARARATCSYLSIAICSLSPCCTIPKPAGNHANVGYRCNPGGLLRARRSRTGQIGDHVFFQGRVTSRTRRGGCTIRPLHLTLGTQATLWLPLRRAANLRVSKVPPEARVPVVVHGRCEYISIFPTLCNLCN